MSHNFFNVEMQEVSPSPGFELEVSRTGYNHNLVWASENMEPGSNSPVTEREDRMLDEDPQTRAPETGWPGLDGNTGHPITNKQ